MNELKTPTVVHLKRSKGQIITNCDVYIGRRIMRGGWDLPQSKWANPFTIKKCGGIEKVIEKYREHVKSKPELISSLHELTGKRLGCWCKPNSCHGDILVELWKAHVGDIKKRKQETDSISNVAPKKLKLKSEEEEGKLV